MQQSVQRPKVMAIKAPIEAYIPILAALESSSQRCLIDFGGGSESIFAIVELPLVVVS